MTAGGKDFFLRVHNFAPTLSNSFGAHVHRCMVLRDLNNMSGMVKVRLHCSFHASTTMFWGY